MWTVWIALLLWAAPTQGVSTTCEIPAVERLQNTSLTCKFSEDISKRKQDFEVHFYKNNTTDSSETILHCYWIGNKLDCRVHSCCEYDGHVTANLTLRVLSVTDARVGRYVCFVLPAVPDGNNFCNFSLRVTEKITDKPAGNLAALAVLVVIPVIICITIIIIVWRRKCDDGTRTTKESSQTLGGNELQTENETKDQKTQVSDVYKYTSNIAKEGRKAKSVRKKTNIKEKVAQDKAEKDEKIAKDKAEKEIKSAREKAQKLEKLVKENAENEEATSKGKAEELEKIAKEKAEKEEKMANKKAKEEEKIAKDNAAKEEGIAKRASKKMSSTAANIEEKVKKISNEKEDQMTKIAKRKEEQMEFIAKEKEKQLEKIAQEKREELEKIANDREKRLEQISKRTAEEIERIKRKKEEEIEKVRKVKREPMQTIISKKEEKIETINKVEEDQRKIEEKENKRTALRESHDVQRNEEQLKIKEIEDDANEVDHAKETDPCLDTNNSNVQVSPATRSQGKPHTIIQMYEPASHRDTLEAPTGTRDQTLQAVDKVVTPVKKNNEDKASKRNAYTEDKCTVS